jgi:hypothetical protein
MPQPSILPKNRRGSLRRQAKRASKVSCYKGALGFGPNLTLEVLDLSEGGARLRVKEVLEKGQEVVLQIIGLGYRVPIKVQAMVIWCVAAADGSHCIGARFAKSLRYGDLQLLTG